MYNYNLGLLFSEVVKRNPEQTALFYDKDTKVSYSELNRLSNQIANWLIEKGIVKQEVIGIFNTKKKQSFALMLAALKLGIVYVNLDITSPTERLIKITNRCQQRFLFFDDPLGGEKALKLNNSAIDLSSQEFLNEITHKEELELTESKNICSDNPAYIMFTSGSTGFPKGSVMTHQNLLSFIGWASQTYDITPKDVFSNANPMYFDNSVFDFYASIFNGATMAPFDAETTRHPGELVKKVDEVNATIWFSVPSLLVFLLTMKALTTNVFRHIRVIIFGGEGFQKPKLKQLFDIFSYRVRIVNVYGPTECTCICSSYDIGRNDFDDMISLAPLGYLAPNFDYIIVDSNGNSTEEGELLLAGPQVSLGYYNDQERTYASFIQHPDIKNYPNTVYKTGDIVRLDENKMLHILGRLDNQIKHMGYRIELEEIEAGFATLKYVDEVGVIYEKFENGLGQIKAFVKLNAQIEIDTIQQEIRKILAPYMVPKIIRLLENMPKNQNGKIDRLKLKTLK